MAATTEPVDIGAPEVPESPTIDPKEFEAIKGNYEKATQELERFKAKHAEAEKHRKEQEQATRKAMEEAAKKSGDVEALEKSWKEKLESVTGEYSQKQQAYERMVESLTIGATSTSIAADIAMDGCVEGLIPHIRTRIRTVIENDQATVKVIDKNGNLSAMTIDDLKKELKATSYLAPLIKGSNASGTGHNGAGAKGAAGAKEATRADFDAMNPVQRFEFVKKGGKVVD